MREMINFIASIRRLIVVFWVIKITKKYKRYVMEEKINEHLELASIFKTGQYGRLFIESRTSEDRLSAFFRIFVLPNNFIVHRPWIPPVNEDCVVEVYGPVGEACTNLGFGYKFDWKEVGDWIEDFYELKYKLENKIVKLKDDCQKVTERKRVDNLLSSYQSKSLVGKNFT